MSDFRIQTDGEGHLLSLRHAADPYGMNWVEGATPWGTVKISLDSQAFGSGDDREQACPIHVQIERELTAQGTLRERYTFTNASDYAIYTQVGDISICTCFNDSYESAEICRTQRCHAHVWCGGAVSWVMALRMGGEGPHLGLALTEGSLEHYSVRRDASQMSNDRGDILLHPAPMRLEPGESSCIAWELFWFETRAQFFERLATFPGYISVTADRYVAFQGETIHLTSSGSPASLTLRCDTPGEKRVRFVRDGRETHADVLFLPDFQHLTEARVRFIAERQQCMEAGSPLYGAYLIYDNETERQYYSHVHDHNAARERMGMGVLIARWLRSHPDEALQKSLENYLDFVYRELFDAATGTVYNDYRRSLEWHRLYNYAWAILLFSEVYQLTGNVKSLRDSARAYLRFCECGGTDFYAICLDECALCRQLEAEGLDALASAAREGFRRHAETLLALDVQYRPMEVNYEQSIVQPAMETMLCAYEYFGDARYLESARRHLRLLELFNGSQPNYHMNEVAMRHWDGYWFGKRRLFGDTLPHYWSALTGHAFMHYAALTGEAAWRQRGEAALRAPLCLFTPEGRASCAWLWPLTVNDQPAHGADPWANDQDWAMYYYLIWHDGLRRKTAK